MSEVIRIYECEDCNLAQETITEIDRELEALERKRIYLEQLKEDLQNELLSPTT